VAKPQTNTNQLVNDVANKIISNEQFGEWAAAKFRRKIEKLPTELEQSQLYGLFYTAQRNADLAIKAFDKAMVSSSANSNVALN
jgi:cytochrome c-type biogenesis protein CcmH/NrfG